ncbi:competence protein CoiA [Thiothrix winogradskyi]|uniref:Competence protein n=1 Tax=Thiothrix winogradskyi TaxID=96472 RepID=A0ABY3SVZ9_9GAMM|nr:competence protein CoiA family protein [Thiothrix winogradskyi]UJS22665.1 hypothetical protein L2Y54_11985 [Thiothrix winogradskyi]
MQFSLVKGVKSKPSPSIKGNCIFCGELTIAKCGKYKIWHWAHKSKAKCDPWWENETEWHRKWKNYFPPAFQEIIHIDSRTNEKHIADIKTQNNMVIEFQNSSITPEEVASREIFYKNMFWIVNGDRKGTLDGANFNISIVMLGPIVESLKPLIITFAWDSSKLFERWANSSTPVFFDFNCNELFRLLSHDHKQKKVTVKLVDKKTLIEKNGGSYEESDDKYSIRNWIYQKLSQ